MRVALGTIGFITLLVIAVAPFLSPREQLTPSATGEKGAHTKTLPDKPKTGEEEENIRGSMTLEAIERSTGVPVKYLLKQLDLPENTSPDQKLGQLS